MPKIIENLPERLLEETRRQIEESGYGSLTVRAVAKNCGVGVGTVYNYYRSKDELVASFMLEDWKACISAIGACAETADSIEPVLRAIYDSLTAFISRHRSIFSDKAAVAAFGGSIAQYHGLLRSQLAAPLRRFCEDDFTAEFAAESMLTWTVAGVPFEKLYELVRRLFDKM